MSLAGGIQYFFGEYTLPETNIAVAPEHQCLEDEVSFCDALLKGVSAVSFSECELVFFFCDVLDIYRVVKHLVGEEYFQQKLRVCLSNIHWKMILSPRGQLAFIAIELLFGGLYLHEASQMPCGHGYQRYLVFDHKHSKAIQISKTCFLRRYSVAVQACLMISLK